MKKLSDNSKNKGTFWITVQTSNQLLYSILKMKNSPITFLNIIWSISQQQMKLEEKQFPLSSKRTYLQETTTPFHKKLLDRLQTWQVN